MTVREWLVQAQARLAGVDSPKLEAELLLAHAVGQSRTWLHAHGDVELRFSSLADALLERRLSSEPLAYILGYREFYGRKFLVGPGVLIPRHETELLVDVALKAIDRGASQVLDLGSGSGAIGVTVKLERPQVQVTLADDSRDAFKCSKRNSQALRAAVRLVRSDLFSNLEGERFDLVVSNPPYIGRTELLPDEVVLHEPEEALFAGEDGFAILRRIAEEAADHLTEMGELWLEVGYRQADAVRRIYDPAGWSFLGSREDLLGHERVLGFKPRLP